MSQPELPGISEIGCGYNVLGDYASSLDIKLPLFDLYHAGTQTVTLDPHNATEATFKFPSAVVLHRANTTAYYSASGSSSSGNISVAFHFGYILAY
jgi:hypothetical protein